MVYGTRMTLLGGNLFANQVVTGTRTDGESATMIAHDTVGWAHRRTAAAGPAKNS